MDANFGDILALIKEAYDERLDLVPKSDTDSVAMSAYTAVKSKMESAQVGFGCAACVHGGGMLCVICSRE